MKKVAEEIAAELGVSANDIEGLRVARRRDTVIRAVQMLVVFISAVSGYLVGSYSVSRETYPFALVLTGPLASPRKNVLAWTLTAIVSVLVFILFQALAAREPSNFGTAIEYDVYAR